MPSHIMITRSKKYITFSPDDTDSTDELDDDGNLKDFIVNDLKSNTDKIIIRKKKSVTIFRKTTTK